MINIKEQSLMFAPMEGITDEYYRNVVSRLYPEWDTFSCDFLRVPTTAPYPKKHVIKHYGKELIENNEIKNKTIYQILTSPGAFTVDTVKTIEELEVKWLDLNLGCPSKTVCRNKGGSFLLSELSELQKIIRTIRQNYKYTFTCKIRVGYRDDSNFENILKLLQDEGVDAIKIHARTRDELYKGVANWDYVKRAVELVNTPIIGNGDIWNVEDIKKYFEYTGCHSIMLARSALKTPWLAKLYKEEIEETPKFRTKMMIEYFKEFYEETKKQPNLIESSRIKRIKSVCRYIFDDLPEGEIYRRKVLLSKSFDEQISHLQELLKKLN